MEEIKQDEACCYRKISRVTLELVLIEQILIRLQSECCEATEKQVSFCYHYHIIIITYVTVLPSLPNLLFPKSC